MHKLKFLLLRLLGATALVGAAAFILLTIFKLMICIVTIIGLGVLAFKIMRRRYRGSDNQFFMNEPFSHNLDQPRASAPIQPIFTGKTFQENKKIIPIL